MSERNLSPVGSCGAERLGANLNPNGDTVFGVYSGSANWMQVELLRPDGTREQHEMDRTDSGLWRADVPGNREGWQYLVYANGPQGPGNQFNPNRPLLDPYARGVQVAQAPNGGVEYRGVVLSDPSPLELGPPTPIGKKVIYEAHVRWATMNHPDVPPELRGTFAGFEYLIPHLRKLGITSIQLMPIQETVNDPPFASRSEQSKQGWGYWPLSFFAPNARYSAAESPRGRIDEFRHMVQKFAEAGIEVIMDVVYNHTCEGAYDAEKNLPADPIVSLRGLDPTTYYLMDHEGRDIDHTGCRSTLACWNKPVAELVLDSLRYWARMGVRGFRFDLGAVLAKTGPDTFDPIRSLIFRGIMEDPLLSRLSWLTEPWACFRDHYVNGFPIWVTTYNPDYRDGMRLALLRKEHDRPHNIRDYHIGIVAMLLDGSPNVYRGKERTNSLNYITGHDGPTLWDLVCYWGQYNDGNDPKRWTDKADEHFPYNEGGGVEGPTYGELSDDPEQQKNDQILQARLRAVRLIKGVQTMTIGPLMLLGGDEIGRTQGGNTNPYDQDNDRFYTNWGLKAWQEELFETQCYLLQLRKQFPILNRTEFLKFAPNPELGGKNDACWYKPDGQPFPRAAEQDADKGEIIDAQGFHAGQVLQAGRDESLLVMINGDRYIDETFRLPDEQWVGDCELLWDSSWDRPPQLTDQLAVHKPGSQHTLPRGTMRIYKVKHLS